MARNESAQREQVEMIKKLNDKMDKFIERISNKVDQNTAKISWLSETSGKSVLFAFY